MAANPTFTNRTYAGEFFAEMFAPIVLDPAGLEDNQLATVIDRVKFKDTIYEGDDTVEFQTASPTFTAQSSTADVAEVNLSLVPYDFMKEMSLDNLRESWFSQNIAPGSLNDYEDGALVDFYVSQVYTPKLKQAQDNLVLNGKTGLDASVGSYSFSASYTGLYGLFNASSDVRKISIAGDQIAITAVVKGTTTGLTVASDVRDSLAVGQIISIRNAGGTGWSAINGDWEVQELTATSVTINVDTDALTNGDYDGNATIQFINANNMVRKMATHLRSLPAQIRRNGAKIVIPEHLELEWQYAVSEAQQNGGSYYLKAHDLQLINSRIVVLDNAPANTIGSWLPKHVFYGYDLSNDYSTVNVVWQGDKTLDQVYRLKGAMKTGIQISTKFANEITLSTPDA